MAMLSLRKILAPLFLATVLLLSSCNAQPPSRFQQAQEDSTAKGASAVVKESLTGGTFNQFFPQGNQNYQRVFIQEKKGFAEAKLKQNGEDIARLTISDILNNPKAANKFKESQEEIAGYPAAKQGTSGTTVLVAERFQVKVLSVDESFTESDRREWISKFDLSGLARLNK